MSPAPTSLRGRGPARSKLITSPVLASERRANDRILGGVSRRNFLQAALALGGTAAINPDWFMGRAMAGPPLGVSDGVVVLIQLSGGIDGLNTLVPIADPAYAVKRGALALTPDKVLPIDDGMALHGSLSWMKSAYDAGRVAIVRGAGHGDLDHSHFSGILRVMSGIGGPAITGWAGRWLDGAGLDGFGGVTVGDSGVPLLLHGAHSEVTGLPGSGSLYGADRSNVANQRLFDTLIGLGNDPHGMGSWADTTANEMRDALNASSQMNPIYAPAPPSNPRIARDLTLAARIINLDVGARVIRIEQGGYDTHADEPKAMENLLGALDGGLSAFFGTLSPSFADRVTVVTFTEFGRRVETNSSVGTDHGTCAATFVIGNRVNGGLHGDQPSLTNLDSRGDLRQSVDVRSIFATVVGEWLGGDDAQIFASSYDHLPLFASSPGGGGDTPGVPYDFTAFNATLPARVLDTRRALGARPGPLGAGESIDVTVAGHGGVPGTGAAAVILNVTVTEPSIGGYLTVWPSGEGRPNVSNINMKAKQTVPNLVITKLSADGKVGVFNAAGTAHVLMDVAGWFPADAGYEPLSPQRLLDTRDGTGGLTGPLGPGAVHDLVVTGRGGVPSMGVDSVVLNVTVDSPTSISYVTAWPTGQPRPNASNLNMAPKLTVANLVVAKVGANGKISLYNDAGSTNLIADVFGYFKSNSGFTALTPTRILDTRLGIGAPATKVGPGGAFDLAIRGAGGVPAGAKSVMLNLTGAEATTAGGYVTVWPAGEGRPDASNLNLVPGRAVPNMVVAKLGSGGAVSLFNAIGSVHLIGDVVGYFS
jgi:uncharacterized protein (DUF1501 family)